MFAISHAPKTPAQPPRPATSEGQPDGWASVGLPILGVASSPVVATSHVATPKRCASAFALYESALANSSDAAALGKRFDELLQCADSEG